MIAVIFEAKAAPHQARYLQLAAELKTPAGGY